MKDVCTHTNTHLTYPVSAHTHISTSYIWTIDETVMCTSVYEAGKMIKSTQPTPIPMYPTYYLPGVPSIIPQPSLSVIEPKMASVPPSVEHNGPGGE